MASSKLSKNDRYSVRNPSRGLLVIISNENFEGSPNLKRSGTEKDVERLKKTFGQLGFEANIHIDQSCVDMLQIMDDVAVSDLEPFDCLAVVILSHGDSNFMIAGVGKGKDIRSLFDILAPLKSISKEIPKLVFVQACQGGNYDRGHTVQSDGISHVMPPKIRVPEMSDFLYYFATCPGYVASRNADGSIFIQSVCDVFDKYIEEDAEIDLMDVHLEVNRRVAERFKFEIDEEGKTFEDLKQQPSFMSMLRKRVILKKQSLT